MFSGRKEPENKNRKAKAERQKPEGQSRTPNAKQAADPPNKLQSHKDVLRQEVQNNAQNHKNA